jgi:amino acid transporter
MTAWSTEEVPALDEDARKLRELGYSQELSRRLNGFSNFAVSFSIICILAGGVTSFHLGLSSAGGAAVGLVWPAVCLFSLAVAATMSQFASTFPTAGGLYHWAAILGGRGWGWATAWFNLLGLVTVLAAINVGTYRFALNSAGAMLGLDLKQLDPMADLAIQAVAVCAITLSQAGINHLGIGLTARLTDFSGYWILLIAAMLTVALLAFSPSLDFGRLFRVENLTGEAGGGVWPRVESVPLLLALAALLPAYTITGFDASAHVSEETQRAAATVPRGIVRSVAVSGLAGWIMLCAVVLAAPSVASAAAQGEGAFVAILKQGLPGPLCLALFLGIALAQYLCGLATVTSASRMAFAFARDGGLPFSRRIRSICPRRKTPPWSIWTVAIASVLFTLWTPVYSTITAVCTIFLYVSYVLPTVIGAWTYRRRWIAQGPWDLGPWYRPLAAVSTLGCVALIAIGMHPPNERAAWVCLMAVVVLTVVWIGFESRRFQGPPAPATGRDVNEELSSPQEEQTREEIVAPSTQRS